MKLINNIIYKILSVQEKFLMKRLSKTVGIKNKSKRKRSYGDGVLVDFNSLAEVEKQKLEEELTLILTKYEFNPEKILDFIQSQGTKVVYLKEAYKLLNPIKENEGFIYPAKGTKALYLSLGVFKRVSFKTEEMFVLSKGEINKYYFIYHLYNWFAFKHNIDGMDCESQALLKKFLFNNEGVENLQLEDIYKLKDAIKQDKASIEFVIKLCRNYEGAKQALDKMKNEGSAKL